MRFSIIFLILVGVILMVHDVDAQQNEDPKQCIGENDNGGGSCSSGYVENDITTSSHDADDDSNSQQSQEEEQIHQPDVNNDVPPVNPPRVELSQCGLYMAESSIPHAGWGMYTGKKLLRAHPIDPLDVVIDFYDATEHHRFFDDSNEKQTRGRGRRRRHGRSVPQWLMDQYHWSPEITKSQFAADMINSIMPGFGMLANSHTGLVNAENTGSTTKLWSYINDDDNNNDNSTTRIRIQHKNQNDDDDDATRQRSRIPPSTGAYSHLQGLTFIAKENLEPGHEIFVEYGDHWFKERANKFGNIPLSDDFEAADGFLKTWSDIARKTPAKKTNNHKKKSTTSSSVADTDIAFANELWNFTMDLVFEVWDLDSPQADPNEKKRLVDLPPHYTRPKEAADKKKRFRNALPRTGQEALDWLDKWPTQATAKASVPNLVRSLDWLDENGYCLDNIQVRKTIPAGRNGKYVNKGMGAFASRFLKNGTVVAPAPLIHLSRDHMKMRWTEPQSANFTSVVWEGCQLLLNYCYGHPSSSLLFFPYSPVVNLINHGRPANVALRWAKDKMGQPELLTWSPLNVLESNQHAGLMMEIYALRDIQEGEEILLDYGDDWQESWDRHVEQWIPPVHAKDYKSALFYDTHDELFTVNDPRHPPSYIQTRCWIEYDAESEPDDDGFYECQEPNSNQLDDTVPCTILEVEKDEDSGEVAYKIEAVVDEGEDNEKKVLLENVYWHFITYVEKAYMNDQQIRHGFRHMIELPDEMIPVNWRDLPVVTGAPSDSGNGNEENESCGLYMAESAIPGSGLGMFTAKEISEGDKIFYGDVCIVAEDVELNFRLRQWYEGKFDDDDEDKWLMEHYWWTPQMTLALFEAGDVQNILPGIGMLANSHTGLHNAQIVAPEPSTTLHRGWNPGAGASTTHHNLRYIASQDIEEGAEIYAEYTDSYFEERADLGSVPLSTDFIKADEILEEFKSKVGGDFESESAHEAWEWLISIHSNDTRLISALPKQLADVPHVLEMGTAKFSVPNRVRSIEWLQSNGRCLDNIRPGRSTIREADQGAFATRKIRNGDVVAPVPVVQLHRRHMYVFNSDNIEDPDAEVRKEGLQLLLNYVYGHPDSNLLMFPYSPVVNYLNHNASTYNAKLRWSTLPSQHSDWLEKSPEELVTIEHAGLIMELVATRDIEAGEEVLISYGDAWESAWNEHVQNWKPYPDARKYVAAAHLNKRAEWLRTPEELETHPYPPNVFLGCFVKLSPDRPQNSSVPPRWEYTAGLYASGHEIMPCEVVQRNDLGDPNDAYDRRDSIRPVETKYTMRVYPPSDEDEDENGNEKPVPDFVMGDVPRRAIRFIDDIYTSDQFLRDVFRHEIHLPDEMVPPAWRDRRNSDTAAAAA